MSTEFYWVAVALTTIISAARLTRLAVYDKFPPAQWIGDKYLDATDGTGWGLLALCGFCMSFWITLFVVAAGLLCGVYAAPVDGWPSDEPFAVWWIINGILAASYLAASYVARDGDDGEDD